VDFSEILKGIHGTRGFPLPIGSEIESSGMAPCTFKGSGVVFGTVVNFISFMKIFGLGTFVTVIKAISRPKGVVESKFVTGFVNAQTRVSIGIIELNSRTFFETGVVRGLIPFAFDATAVFIILVTEEGSEFVFDALFLLGFATGCGGRHVLG